MTADCTIIFTFIIVTLDYKALIMMVARRARQLSEHDEEIALGGRGPGVEFCVFCRAVRVYAYIY